MKLIGHLTFALLMSQRLLGERTSEILMVISLCLLICNDKASLMQLLLSDIVASFGGSSELNPIFSQLAITVSYETIHRYITIVVDALTQNHMKSSFFRMLSL